MKKLALLFAGLVTGGAAMAQISITGSNLTYTQDFNTLGTSGTGLSILPTGWEIYEWGGTGANTTYRAGDGSANSGDTYSFGNGTNTDRALGSLGSTSVPKINYGATFVNNTGTNITGVVISFTQEQWRSGGATATNIDTTRVLYSLTSTIADSNFTGWTEIPTLLMQSIVTGGGGTALDGNMNMVAKTATEIVTIPSGSTFTLRFFDWNSAGTDDANSIDDLTITFITGTPPPPNYKPMVVYMSPMDNAMGVPATTTTLMMVFDRVVEKGTGSITIFNSTAGSNQAFGVNSSNVTLNNGASGDTVTITGVTLNVGNSYYVNFDSTAFDTANYNAYGIYDQTTWNFSTTQGTPTSVNETFDAACAGGGLPTGWMRENVSGPNQQWNCGGGGTNKYMQMNGYAANANNDNEDWLITPAIDLSGVTNPTVLFRAMRRFDNYDNLNVLYSTNYTGAGNPNNASWTNLNVSWSSLDTGVWKTFSGPLMSTNPIYVAFRYTCTAAAGDCAQWRVDSVVVTGTTSILSVKGNNQLPVAVLGAARCNNILVGFAMEKAAVVTASVYDLTGRIVYSRKVAANAGTNRISLDPALSSGMYIIRISSDSEYGVTKAVVE